jgi:NodT family efflux transporter outer membrane factor (OMF) lipoprotein
MLYSLGSLFAACGWLILNTTACMVGPDFHSPRSEAPPVWHGVTEAPAAQSSVPTTGPAELTQWWKQFGDPVLTQLVEDALRANLNVKLAIAGLRQARAAQGIAAAALWPSLSAFAAYQRESNQHESSPASPGQALNLYQAGFDAAWELDFFGGQRRNVESAKANAQAAVEGLRDAQVSIAAEVALDYIQLRSYQQQIVVARNNLKAMQDTAEIVRQKATPGFDCELDIANADANVATMEAQIPVLETSAGQSIYALSVLLAKPPADLLEQLQPTGKIPDVPAKIPAGLPSDLLRRRADIRQAEAQLHSATAQIGVATAALFPQFSLTGALGVQSAQLSALTTNAGRVYSGGPSVTWQIFQGGAIISNIHMQEALRDQAFITYQQTVLAAFQDVENALVAFNKEQQHHKSLKDSVEANAKAVDLSTKLYTAGLIEFLNVLSAQNALYNAQNALTQSNGNMAADIIALYKALGGGWETIPADL